MKNQKNFQGSEVEADAARKDNGPKIAGGQWNSDTEKSDRFLDVEQTAAEADTEIESGGSHAGMGRGEKPRKLDE